MQLVWPSQLSDQVRLHERPSNSSLQDMASGWSGPWGGAGGDQWSSWGAPYGGKQQSKGFGGKPKGGKSKKGKQQESAPAWAPHPEAGAEAFGDWPEPQPTPSGTGRILSRYQFPKALLKTAPDADGSVFYKDNYHKRQDDFTYLSTKELKKRPTSDDHHLLRRPGVGLSEAAGAIQAGSDVLGNLKQLGFGGLEKILLDPAVVEALHTLNTLDEKGGQREQSALTSALRTLHQKLVLADNNVEELAVKATVAASRLYVMGAHLLPLLAAMGDPAWWQQKLPAEMLESERGSKWRAAPSDPQRMVSALAGMVREKVEEYEGHGKNDAASLFARKPGAPQPATTPSPSPAKKTSDSDSADKKKKDKKRKAKKDNKKKNKKEEAKKSKKKKSTASSSPSSSKSSKTSSVKPKKEKKQKNRSRNPQETAKPGPTASKSTVKVHRVSGATQDGKIVVKGSDLHDDVDITNEHMTVGDIVDQLLTTLNMAEDAPNWSCKLLEENGEISAVAPEFPASQLVGDLVMVAKGG